MVNYGNVPGMQQNYNTGMQGAQAQAPTKPATDYSSWINPQPNQAPQPAPPTEQRGITVSYMVQSRAEYASIYPPAGQTVAIFNFPDHELCLKAKDMWGIDLGMRTFDLTETTPIAQVQNGQATTQEKQADPQVTKAEFDELKASLNSLIKELKG
jgi:hypothetical protein